MLIIFDCDGTLRSASWEGLFKTYIKVIEYAGKEYRDFFKNFKEFKQWWNPDWHKNSRKIGIGNSPEFNEFFHKSYDLYINILPWTESVLQRLSKKHSLALFSAASDKSILKTFGVSIKYFEVIACCEQVINLKPDPEGINFILQKTKSDPTETLMIGDMIEDIMAGRNAGVKTGAVSWGLGEWEQLIGLKPNYLFKKPRDLLSI